MKPREIVEGSVLSALVVMSRCELVYGLKEDACVSQLSSKTYNVELQQR